MRSRFRSQSGPRSTNQGRPLELVRVRGTQRDTGSERRELRGGGRLRRRGGRGRSRGPRPPASAPQGFSLWRWLQNLFAPRPQPAAGRPSGQRLSEQETKIVASFSRHYGITFRDPELLKLALTHRSYLSVTGMGPRDSNERLEFLGDSVLGLVTSEFLYREHPTEHEGQLTKTKSLLVSKAILSRRALAMGLGRFVLMSHSEIESGGRQRLSILADAFESVVGAIYLDQGFEAGRAFITRWLLRETREIVADKRHTNFKSHLQEYVQSTYRTHPVYRIRSEIGPDHSKQFNVEVMVGKRVLGSGKGRNKKEAEQAAARNALEQVGAPTGEREARPARPGRERPGTEERAPRIGERSPSLPGTGVAETETPRTQDEESDDDDDAGRRRRRGRRGGRGRRKGGRPEDQPVRPAASAPAVTPSPAPIESRPAPAREEPVDEEPSSAFESGARFYEEEEEFEEVGRPEGPLEERHIDPFAFDSPAEEAFGGAPASSEPSDRFEPSVDDEIEPEVSATEEPESETEQPEGDAGAPPSYGRRFGRSRRGPRGS